MVDLGDRLTTDRSTDVRPQGARHGMPRSPAELMEEAAVAREGTARCNRISIAGHTIRRTHRERHHRYPILPARYTAVPDRRQPGSQRQAHAALRPAPHRRVSAFLQAALPAARRLFVQSAVPRPSSSLGYAEHGDRRGIARRAVGDSAWSAWNWDAGTPVQAPRKPPATQGLQASQREHG